MILNQYVIIKHQSLLSTFCIPDFVQPNKSFSTSTTVKFYSSCYNDNKINLDDQIAKNTFSTPLTYLNLSQEHR
jgi:hypothetical protein